ncbi:hypothetical protein C8Q80DRAFT_178754 [Daedaleopsis nitida]|nr:hypothetical protein C8Q80DRAFT_178754 [Daedaleopsis nitida]
MILLYQASIFSTFFEGMLYGFSLLLFIMTVWFLGKRNKRRVSYAMLGASCALMLLSTADIAVNVARMYQGLVSVGPTLVGGPEQYFDDDTRVTVIVKTSLWATETLILDAVLIYRTYVVWQSFVVIIIPSLGWCGLLVTSIGTNIVRANRHSALFAVEIGSWITTMFALDLSTNLVATSMLAYKINSVIRKTSQVRSSSGLSPFLRVVIESGALYSATILVGLILFLIRSDGFHVVNDLTSPVISIVFNIIFVRLGLAQELSPNHRSSDVEQTDTSFVVILAPHENHDNPNFPGHPFRRRSALGESVEHGDDITKITEMYLTDEDMQDAGEMHCRHSVDGILKVPSAVFYAR